MSARCHTRVVRSPLLNHLPACGLCSYMRVNQNTLFAVLLRRVCTKIEMGGISLKAVLVHLKKRHDKELGCKLTCDEICNQPHACHCLLLKGDSGSATARMHTFAMLNLETP